MKIMDEAGLRLCKMQGDIFVLSLSKTFCSTPVFLRRFMYSSAALRMDRGSLLYESSDADAILREIESEFGESSYGKERYSVEELYWMGYLYRYWCYSLGKTSKQVYKIIKPKELRSLYYPYHSLDPSQAIERILEAKEIKEADYTERGTEILRRILKRRN